MRIILRLLLILIICVGLLVGSFFFWFYTGLGLPKLEDLKTKQLDQTSKIYAADGTLLTELHGEQNRETIPLSEMSEYLKHAVVAIEDERFYQHHGVDWLSIARAFWTNVVKREVVQGASTITQQFVKNTLTGKERTYWRKVQEANLAYQLEKKYSKEKILEFYLNDVYFGQGCYGAKKASEVFFGKQPDQLTLSESALLAGLIRAPNRYSPYFYPENAKKRRDLVIGKMLDLGYVTEEEAARAKSESIAVKPIPEESPSSIAPYFVEYVIQYLKQNQDLKSKFDNYSNEDIIYRGGLRVYTTIDLNLQRLAEEAANSTLYLPTDPTAALCAIDPRTGEIKAMVGGRDFTKQKFNIAAQGGRQAGSAFKVFTLVAALSIGMSPNKTYDSSPTTLEFPDGTKWKVKNAEGASYGTITVRQATIRSVNVVYARMIRDVGPQRVVEFARAMGITSPLEPYPSIALGALTHGVNPLEMASAFGTLANNGMRVPPICVTKITDANGKVLLENFPSSKRVIREDIAAKANELLQEAVKSGTGRAARIGRPQAGKTGTTDDYTDAWFCGYTPDLSCAVWVGYPQGRISMTNVHGITVYGGTFPAQIWKKFMEKALVNVPPTPFPSMRDEYSHENNNEEVEVTICADSGLLANAECPHKIKKKYRAGEEPTEHCNLHGGSPQQQLVTVPSVVGMSASGATSLLINSGFRVVESRTSGSAPPNTVISQNPPGGSRAPSGSTVTIVVCNGPTSNPVVPNVVGMGEAAAVSTIYNAGFTVSISYINDPSHVGVVINQHPAGGTTMPARSTVFILVGK